MKGKKISLGTKRKQQIPFTSSSKEDGYGKILDRKKYMRKKSMTGALRSSTYVQNHWLKK